MIPLSSRLAPDAATKTSYFFQFAPCIQLMIQKDRFMGDKSSYMGIAYFTAVASAILRSQDQSKDQYPNLLSFYHSACSVTRTMQYLRDSCLRDILAAFLSRWYSMPYMSSDCTQPLAGNPPGRTQTLQRTMDFLESPAGTSQPQLEPAFRDAECS